MKRFFTFIMFFFLFLPNQYSSAAEQIRTKVEIIPWEKANHFLPRYSKFQVVDTETGLSFNVQRRAGSNHADVQPITTEDTAIMKKIYNDNWSWRRRAIIVKYKHMRIAASMHGMPHGAGALKNNFPGHFCIHFYGSTTHRTNEMDLSHKLMVLKAAGQLKTHLASLDPYELLNSYIAGYKQQDEDILDSISIQKINWKTILPRVENVRISRVYMLPPEDIRDEIYLSIPIELDWYVKGEGRAVTKSEVHLVRFTPYGPWRVDTRSFLKTNPFLQY